MFEEEKSEREERGVSIKGKHGGVIFVFVTGDIMVFM